MITATRTHEICCGHRVFGHEGKCRNLHGHNYTVEFTCAAFKLDPLGRVVDFGVIKDKLCQWLEDHWDHKLLLWCDDPAAAAITTLGLRPQVVAFNPTAENMAEYLGKIVGPAMLSDGVRLVRVRVGETGKCFVTWEAE
jgi:6-pyruvoyltetrahydropterin/6-carboxytetrahydropterin synthase